MHALVVGGGVIGMMTARNLVQAGCSVRLFDQAAAGSEASWAGGGIMSPLYPWRYPAPVNQLASWSQQHYPSLAAKLVEETGIDPELRTYGMLMLGGNDSESAIQWASANNAQIQEYDEQALRSLLPPYLDVSEQALWMPEIRGIRSPRLLKALLVALQASPLFELHTNETVLRLEETDGRVQRVITSKECYCADAIIICAGAWSAALLEPFGYRLPIKPVRGQMLAIQAPAGWLPHILMKNGAYLIPREDGLILAGSTLEFVGFNKALTETAKSFLLQRAYGMLPALKEFPVVHHWAGLRPSSPNGIPYIGPIQGLSGVYINAGHYRNGLVMAPASGRLIADIVLGRSPMMDATPFLPCRELVS
ncbi:Putative D-amino acid oxidase [gamma proteobacterium HdN1]|nr:Putative D-amino acid oxidase [gamma proteobacterium HdN1]